MPFNRTALFALLLCISYNPASSAQTNSKNESGKTSKTPQVVVQADGTVELPPESVPVSKFLTPEAKAYLT